MGDVGIMCHEVLRGDTVLDHISGVFVCLVLVFITDRLLLRVGPLASFGFGENAKARWFALHSVTNWCIVFFSLQDCLSVIQSPVCAMVMPLNSFVPSYFAFSLHAYHFLAYTGLRGEDIVHHLLFVAPLGYVNFQMCFGPIVNILLFFMTGLPGAIDYWLLALLKLGKFDRLEEKRINANINVWLRSPGLVCVSTIIFSCIMHDKLHIHKAVAICCMILTFGNGVYYGNQVAKNYEVEKGRTNNATPAVPARNMTGSKEEAFKAFGIYQKNDSVAVKRT